MSTRMASPIAPRPCLQRGQAMAEYLLIVSVVLLVMFVPTPLTNNLAPADLLARAVRSFFRGYSFLVSVF